MSSAVYALGFVIIIIGIAYLAHLMHIPQSYIIAGVIILAGMGILMAVQNTNSGKK